MPQDVSLEEKVSYLASTSAWPDRRLPELVETHMSWVFIGTDTVLKLKKPVQTSFLDFSTLRSREFNCREELRLNRRLAPGVYLDVLPLLRRSDGRLDIGRQTAADASVVDWLVQMRRLDRTRMLDAAVTSGTVRLADIDRLAVRLAEFFHAAQPVRIAGAAYVERFVAAQAINRSVLQQPSFRTDETDAALTAFDQALQRSVSELAARAEVDLREGHGDLRPEHIALDGTPAVIDCLEFNRALREVDPFDELSFLDLECRMLGADWIGPRLMAHCAAELHDMPPPQVIGLYTAHRALVRARLAVTHLLDPVPRTPARWLPLSRRYSALALRALALPNLEAGR